MKQKEIWQVYFDPIIGSEQAGNRPAVIVSGDNLNNNLNVLWVCPLSTPIHNYEGNEILAPNEQNGLTHESEIMVFHIRAISKQRFKKRLGVITKKQMENIKITINDMLDL